MYRAVSPEGMAARDREILAPDVRTSVIISKGKRGCCWFRRCCVGLDTRRGLRMIQRVERGDG